MSAIEEIRAELREIKELLRAPAPHPDDLVGADYIAARTGLAVRTVLEGKAGTNTIPRVQLKSEGGKRPSVRFQRAAVDRWIRDHVARAAQDQPHQRALRLVAKSRRRRSA